MKSVSSPSVQYRIEASLTEEDGRPPFAKLSRISVRPQKHKPPHDTMADLELPRKRLLSQPVLADTSALAESSASSIVPSTVNTPVGSGSSTSLSSLASAEEPTNGKLVDTHGNAFAIPDYTMRDIHNAIPARCFERSALRGLWYVARDMASLAVTFYLFHRFVTPEQVPSILFRGVLWTLYTFVQGLFGTGLWVLAHECGHQSFSPSKVLNDTVGWICHSALLVPYFSWKISHGKHHKATAHLERDMVFVPKRREEFASATGRLAYELSELVEEAPIATLVHMVRQQLGGWPVYLTANVTGHNYHERQREGRGRGKRNGFFGGVNHFNPSSPLYEAKDQHLIWLSDLGLAIVGAVLVLVGRTYGWSNLALWYGAPYLWVNHWLGESSLLGLFASTLALVVLT